MPKFAGPGKELREADHSNDLKCVQELLDEGADVNATGNGGWTTLMTAAWAGNLDMIKLLIDRGVNLNPKERNDEPDRVLMTTANGAVFNH